MIIKVRFNDIQEFKDELEARPPCDQIVRVTIQWTPNTKYPQIRYVSVVAGYLRDMAMNNMQLIELTKYVGEDWGRDIEISKETRARADMIVKDLTTFCKVHGWDCRAGAYDVADETKAQSK